MEALDRATDQNALDFTMSRLPPSRTTQVCIMSNGSETVATVSAEMSCSLLPVEGLDSDECGVQAAPPTALGLDTEIRLVDPDSSRLVADGEGDEAVRNPAARFSVSY